MQFARKKNKIHLKNYFIIIFIIILVINCPNTDSKTDNNNNDDNEIKIENIDPVNNSNNISLSSNIIIQFNKEIDTSVIGTVIFSNPSITFTNGSNCTVIFSGNDSIIINPDYNLENNTTYSSISINVFKDNQGKDINISDSTYSFTTENKLIGGQIYDGTLSLNYDVSTFVSGGNLNNPYGITTDGTYLYVTVWNEHKIKRIAISDGTMVDFAGSGTEGFTDGTSAAAAFSYPFGITTDGENLYITEEGNNAVRKIVISTGIVTTMVSSGLDHPYGITNDGTYLYVADSWNHLIKRIAIADNGVSTIAGDGIKAITDGIGTNAQVSFPISITTDGLYLYFSDRNSAGTDIDTIRKIDLSDYSVTTMIAAAGSGLYRIYGLTLDDTYLYVADSWNHLIKRVALSDNTIITIAGDGAEGYIDDNGLDARFNYPYGIVSDGNNLYIIHCGEDDSDDVIRKIE